MDDRHVLNWIIFVNRARSSCRLGAINDARSQHFTHARRVCLCDRSQATIVDIAEEGHES